MTTTTILRNLGIVAHVDAGKTTLSERVLFYAGTIHRMGEVHDGASTMDTDAVEKAHGITVNAAAARLRWGEADIDLVDTPGHIDFTLEVERSLRVLDGAILVLSGVEGVQPQTRTVIAQLQRHRVPNLAFINKMDRAGADEGRVLEQLGQALGHPTALITLPLGRESALRGIIDVVHGDVVRFTGRFGEILVREPLPADHQATLLGARQQLTEQLAEVDDAIMQAWLDARPFDPARAVEAIRRATIEGRFTPVLAGSAYRNLGVQPLLDAVVAYLPDPRERPWEREGPTDEPCAFVFNLEPSRHGVTAHVRVVQGVLRKGEAWRTSAGKRVRVGRILRRTATDVHELSDAHAGDIVALHGLDVPLGTTLSPSGRVALPGFAIPEPLLGLSIEPASRTDADKLSGALNRLQVRDPSLRLHTDPESGELLLLGMGELHLDIALERLRGEGIEVRVGRPKVAYREAITQAVSFDWTHKKQDGGPGQYARVVGRIEPTDAAFEFEEHVRGGAIAKEYLGACASGSADACTRGPLTGSPVVGVRVIVDDGAMHSNDSSELAFALAARDAIRDAIRRASPIVLEPIMRVDVRGPLEGFGAIQTLLVRRRGTVVGSEHGADRVNVTAEVPLAEMFGFVTALRSATAGEGSFTMEAAGYAPRPQPKIAVA